MVMFLFVLTRFILLSLSSLLSLRPLTQVPHRSPASNAPVLYSLLVGLVGSQAREREHYHRVAESNSKTPGGPARRPVHGYDRTVRPKKMNPTLYTRTLYSMNIYLMNEVLYYFFLLFRYIISFSSLTLAFFSSGISYRSPASPSPTPGPRPGGWPPPGTCPTITSPC